MKGVLFTTDAIFSLLIVAFAITLLTYFEFTPNSVGLLSSSKIQATMTLLTTTHIKNILYGSNLAQKLFYAKADYSWQQYGSDSSKNPVLPSGPMYPFLLYSYYVPNGISSPLVSDYGNLYFGSGDQIYSINLTKGSTSLIKTPFVTTNTELYPSGFGIYSGMLYYTNGTELHSIYPSNGSYYWNFSLPNNYLFTSQPLFYNGKIFLGASSGTVSNVYAINASDGTFSWNTITSFIPKGLTTINGSILVNDLSGNLILIGDNGTILWSTPNSKPTTNLSVSDGIAFLGSNYQACGLNIDGTNSFCGTLAFPTTSILGLNNYSLLFETTNHIGEVVSPGIRTWAYTNPKYGDTVGYPILSNNTMYSLWSNGFILANNISNIGAVVWATKLPSTPIENMILSGGVLSVASGNYIYSFGNCYSNLSSSIAYAITYLYSKGFGSCATYLENLVNPSYNYSIQINGIYAPSNTLYNFNGNSYVYLNYSFESGTNIYLGSSGTGVSLGSSFTPKQWYFVGISNNQSSNTLTAYVNGKAVYSSSAIGTQSYSIFEWIYPSTVISAPEYLNGISINSGSTNLMYLGCETISPCADGFNGIITNLQIYSGALTSGGISTLYDGGIATAPQSISNVAAWLPLEGDTNDYSGNGNTGYPFNLNTVSMQYYPPGITGYSEVSQESILIPLSESQSMVSQPLNKSTQPRIYTLGVYTWK